MSITHNFRAAAVSQWIIAFARPATQVVINRYWQLHCQTLGNRCECHGSTEMTIINGCPLSQYVWHAKELSLFNGHECWAKVKICSPSPVMVTSPYAYSSQCNGAQHYDMPFLETGKLRYLHVWGFFSFCSIRLTQCCMFESLPLKQLCNSIIADLGWSTCKGW